MGWEKGLKQFEQVGRQRLWSGAANDTEEPHSTTMQQ